MPVRRFRSFDEAERSRWLEPGDPAIWQGLLRRWQLHLLLGHTGPPRAPGLYRYRSVEEKAATPPQVREG